MLPVMRMLTGALLFVLVTVAVTSPGLRADPPVAAVEAALEWEPGRIGPFRPMYVPFKAARPNGLEAAESLEDARYARIRWGDGTGLSLAVDVRAGRERLVVDADLDGDLRDETAHPWFGAGVSGTRSIPCRVSYDDEAPAVDVDVRFFHAGGQTPDRVRITPWIHRRGHVVLGGRLRAVALVDDNADLRFDDPERDRLYVDVDGNGTFSTGAGSHEAVGIGTPFHLRGAGWRAVVPHASGAVVRFEPVVDVPPAPPRTWTPIRPPRAGTRATPPAESFEVLRERLTAERDRGYAERVGTINRMGRVGTSESLRALLDVVRRETDANVRAAAARALGYTVYLEEGAKHVVEIATSSWSPPTVVSAAIQALHGMDYPERKRVYKRLLLGNQATIVGAAARYLAYLGTDEAAKAVLEEWRERSNTAMRYQIYLGLRSLPAGPPRDVMVEAAKSENTSLAAYGLRDLLTIDSVQARKSALEGAERRPIVEYFAKAVADVLGRIGDDASVRAILGLAAEGTPALQDHVAKALAPVRDAEAVGALVSSLKAKSPLVRELAARTLGGIREPGVTRALLARVKRERDAVVQTALLEALGDHGDEASVDVLLAQAKRRKKAARRAAIRALARVGFSSPRVRDFLLGLLTARAWEDRILAIDAAAASGDVRVCRKVLPNLAHERRQVRLAAAEAVRKLRCPAAIEPLIKRLEQEEEVRVIDALARALHGITGLNLYDDAALWRRWWSEEGKAFEVPETVEELPPADAGGTRAGFYGIPVRSGRVIFVIDQSGSMSASDPRVTVTGAPSGNRLDVAVREVLAAVQGMGKRDFVNVILFHTTVHPWRDTLARLTPGNRSDLQKHLLAKTPTGGTNLYDALELSLLDAEVDTIFLLSDGVPGSGRYVAKEDILRAVRRLNQTRRIAIHGISIGRDSPLLRELAAQNGGKYARK